MSAVRDGKSCLRWDRPDTLLHWWQLLGWGGDTPWPVIQNIFLIKNNTNGQAGNEKVMLDVDNNKYKRCFLRYCQSLIWKDQSFSFSLCLVWGEDRQGGNEQRVMREIGPHGIIWSSFGTSQANMDQAIYNITRHCKRLPSWIELLGVSIDFFLQDFLFCVKSSSTSVSLSLALFKANWLSYTGHSYANLVF